MPSLRTKRERNGERYPRETREQRRQRGQLVSRRASRRAHAARSLQGALLVQPRAAGSPRDLRPRDSSNLGFELARGSSARAREMSDLLNRAHFRHGVLLAARVARVRLWGVRCKKHRRPPGQLVSRLRTFDGCVPSGAWRERARSDPPPTRGRWALRTSRESQTLRASHSRW
jgi:hypothetical protein